MSVNIIEGCSFNPSAILLTCTLSFYLFTANFGPWELGPQHGFARTSKWQCSSAPATVSNKLVPHNIMQNTRNDSSILTCICGLSQRGDSPFVYRDRGGWPASLPYIRKIRVSVAIGTQSGIRLHQRVPMVKKWGSSKNDQNWTTGKLLKL